VKRLVSRTLVMVTTIAFGIVTFAAAAFAPASAQMAGPNFGAPPSGEVPILFNDQHVYSKPDKLKKGRVLAALVRGKTILVPLRSMFEQMGGATVSYNASTKTVDVSKPGADVQVTVGKPEVVLNGETRPLDVPPEIYKGSVVVPVRVISEALGAYVQWVPDKRVVVVRYLPAPISTPVPETAPPATPTPAPPATPKPTPVPPTPTPAMTPSVHAFIAGDALVDPIAYNEFSPGNKGGISGGARAGLTFSYANLALMAEVNYAYYRYPHYGSSLYDGNPAIAGNGNSGATQPPVCGAGGAAVGGEGCVSTLGPATGQSFVNSFVARDNDFDGRVGLGVASPSVFLVGSYETRYNNYGYPRLTGVGGGLEKLSNFDQPVDIYGSILYYPTISGSYVDIFGNNQKLEYRYLKYQAGLTIAVPKTPLFLDFGYQGNRGIAKTNAPINFSESSLYGGLGLHF
jgi:hypothetical protein